MPFFLPQLKTDGFLDSLYVTLCNVGSRKTASKDDYGTQGWGLFAPNLMIYGFDADPEACAEANAELEQREIGWFEVHLPLAIGKTEAKATLHLTENPQCSSLYPPNQPFLSRFLQLKEFVAEVGTTEVETTSLDAICTAEEIDTIDFLQIDVQGAALPVLQGADALLSRSVLAVQVEVEFSQLYQDQPLFADVDAYLHSKGFQLFDLAGPSRGQRSLLHSTTRPGQLLWADALYLRDPLQAATPDSFKTPEQILKLAGIADILDFTDYALELLEALTLQYGADPAHNVANSIIASLCQIPDLVAQGLDQLPTIQNLRNYITVPIPEATPAVPVAPVLENPTPYPSPIQAFHSVSYLRHNQRRQEHLATLGLNLFNASVLELGAGIGDHTSFFLDRGCQVLVTEGRPENLEVLQKRFPDLPVRLLDMDDPDPTLEETFDIVYSYGLLYHLQKPTEAIAYMADHCRNLLLLETCVSPGEEEAINLCEEPAGDPTQSVVGYGCRPTRPWVFNQLKQHFAYVYMPVTQPNHKEFPIDWTADLSGARLTRSVFIASREPIHNPLLVDGIPMRQQRH